MKPIILDAYYTTHTDGQFNSKKKNSFQKETQNRTKWKPKKSFASD